MSSLPSAPWADVITEDDVARYEAAGFGQPQDPGTRPALVIIDVQYRTIGNTSKPFFQSIAEDYKTSCGSAGWDAVPRIGEALAAFRAAGHPVIYAYVAPKAAYDAGRLGAKIPTIMDIPPQGYAFVEELAPAPSDILIPKRHPSAFFGTSMASYLVDLGVDTLYVTGCTTSGCVRASVVDAFSLNYRVFVPSDGVYDRSETVHQVNLFDMAQKYAEVAPTAELLPRVLGAVG